MSQPIVVTVRVTCVEDSDVPKVVETLSRACAGLALDGLFVALFIQHEHEDGSEGSGCD